MENLPHESEKSKPSGRTSRGSAFLVWLALVVAVALSGCASSGRFGPGAGHFDTVVIDAGHGGHDSGARAKSGANEKYVALDTSKRVAAILRRHGLRVVETRTGDYFITLGERVETAGRYPSAVFVSIHYNWARRAGAHGIETFYHSRRSARLAANIHKEVIRVYKTEDRGLKERGFYVLRNNRRPAVLCELGFMSSVHDNKYIQSPAIRQKLAERIAAGILAERAGREP